MLFKRKITVHREFLWPWEEMYLFFFFFLKETKTPKPTKQKKAKPKNQQQTNKKSSKTPENMVYYLPWVKQKQISLHFCTRQETSKMGYNERYFPMS